MTYTPRMTVQGRLLMSYLAVKSEPAYAYEIQQAMTLNRVSVLKLLARYEEAGFVDRVATPAGTEQLKGGNPRIYFALSEQGQAIVEQLRSDPLFAVTTAALEGNAKRGVDGRVVDLGL